MALWNTKKQVFPSILLNKNVIFPNERVPLTIEGKEAVATVQEALEQDHLIALSIKDGPEVREIAVIANILQSWFWMPNTMGLIVEGVRRMKVDRLFVDGEVTKVETVDLERKIFSEGEETEVEAISRRAFENLKELMHLSGTIPLTIVHALETDVMSPEKTSDVISAALHLKYEEKLRLLELTDLQERLEALNAMVMKELKIIKTEKRIDRAVNKEVNKVQREFILRERLKAIEKELGISTGQKQYDDLEQKLKESKIPENAEERIFKELDRLKRMPPMSPEEPYIRSYLELIADLPWDKELSSEVDFKKTKEILDKDHYGLEKVKERVLEYLAVQKLTHSQARGNILCFVGPPGTGKTSVGQSIAKAMGRKFVRVSLGGIRDEAEIRGHRRTYVGALPGRIIEGIRTAGIKNPIFMLDEIDKIGADFRGDPYAALLEVLDPEQNNAFSDHYVEVPFDLSRVFFITTANVLDTIPPTLRDRMEVIEFSGYTEDEKFQIAKKFLLPKIIESHGLKDEGVKIQDSALNKIIHKYTREAGVRNLERSLAEISRKIAKKIAEGESKGHLTVTQKNLEKLLGPEEFQVTMREEKDEMGIATGLAWTPAGGEIIFIEVSLVPGKGKLTITGQLGKVMEESAKAALSYVRSKSAELGVEKNFYDKMDVHIHVPSGAIPKDGPSAGIAIATALASAVTKRKVKKEVALSGEVTLSGKVLKVGGIKEKVLAAHRAGAEIEILPQENERDLVDVPENIRNELQCKFVKHMDEVLKIALI